MSRKRRRRIKRCKRCRNEYRRRNYMPGVLGSYCNRTNCQRVAKEIAAVNDARRRLEAPPATRSIGVVSGRASAKAVNFGLTYGMPPDRLAVVLARTGPGKSKVKP